MSKHESPVSKSKSFVTDIAELRRRGSTTPRPGRMSSRPIYGRLSNRLDLCQLDAVSYDE